MKRDGEGCGRCVQRSLHETLSVWREWRGARATGRSRGEVEGRRRWVKWKRGEEREERQILDEGSEVDEDRLTNWLTDLFFGKPGDLLCDRRTEACASVCARPECVCVGWEGPASPVDRADCYMPPASAHTAHLCDNTHTKTRSKDIRASFHTLCLTIDYFYLQLTISFLFPPIMTLNNYWLNERKGWPDISKAFFRFSPSSILEMSIPDSGTFPYRDTQIFWGHRAKLYASYNDSMSVFLLWKSVN